MKIIKMSVEKGADIHTRDDDNKTTLHAAIETWDKDVIRFLMESGVNINMQDNKGQTPLHYAVQNGPYFLDLIKEMIEKGADMTIKDKEGKTPLDLALERKHKEIIELLKDRGTIGIQGTLETPAANISGKISHIGLTEPLKFTVLYNNYLYREGTKPDWGFSCLIEGAEKTILFDTGNQPDILLYNVDKLGVDLKKVEQIVISHTHQDHMGGLPAVLERTHEVSVFLPKSFTAEVVQSVEAKRSEVISIDKPVEICPNIYTTGEMGAGIKEQSLIINTEKGLVIVTGCSHQGILEILRRAKELIDRPIHLVFGGFHLGQESAAEIEEIIRQFKEYGVELCGATHCTGETGAFEMFKEAFGERYVPMGVGRILEINKN